MANKYVTGKAASVMFFGSLFAVVSGLVGFGTSDNGFDGEFCEEDLNRAGWYTVTGLTLGVGLAVFANETYP